MTGRDTFGVVGVPASSVCRGCDGMSVTTRLEIVAIVFDCPERKIFRYRSSV